MDVMIELIKQGGCMSENKEYYITLSITVEKTIKVIEDNEEDAISAAVEEFDILPSDWKNDDAKLVWVDVEEIYEEEDDRELYR